MLYESAYFSLLVQLATGAIDIFGLQIKVPEDKKIFRDLLKVELGVQTIEFIFYYWMVSNFSKISNITPYRYLDWFVTTPTMLVTLMAYLDKNKKTSLKEYIVENKSFITKIVVLNLIMLLFGLLAELNYIDYTAGIILGFIPFVYYFKLLYDKYMDQETTETSIPTDKVKLYWFFLIVWSLYGLVAFLPYEQKNTGYNILDLLSKNLFGVFLVYILWKNRIKN